jgi:hypothetical protein
MDGGFPEIRGLGQDSMMGDADSQFEVTFGYHPRWILKGQQLCTDAAQEMGRHKRGWMDPSGNGKNYTLPMSVPAAS